MRIQFDVTYKHPPQKVWRALTDPKIVELWFMRPEGMSLVVGSKFTLFEKQVPAKGWRGFVECTVLKVEENAMFEHSWVGDVRDEAAPQVVAYRLEAVGEGTRLHFSHDGFRGLRGLLLSNLMLRPGWMKKLRYTLPVVVGAL